MYEQKNQKVIYQNLGLINYKEAWDYQEKLFNEIVDIKLENRKKTIGRQQETPNYLLFCQHPHVYTLGKSGNAKHLLLDETGLKEKKASFFKINRGGDITYHGPGQIVGYPILDLDNFYTDIHQFLRGIEQVIINTLEIYGLDAGRIEGLTGVWLDYAKQLNPRKICAIGVRTSRWVTMHGFALNVNTNLDYFNNIIPCGINGKAVTSLSRELGMEMNIAEVEGNLINGFRKFFHMDMVLHKPEF